MLDEPTSGLDPIVRDEVVEVFREFAQREDHSVLISSHILSDLEKLCDSIAFLHQGNLLFCEDKDALLDQYGLFTGTAEQAESLRPEAVAGREARQYGGIRLLVRRDLVPDALAAELERPTVEDVILFTVRGTREGIQRDGTGDESHRGGNGGGEWNHGGAYGGGEWNHGGAYGGGKWNRGEKEAD